MRLYRYSMVAAALAVCLAAAAADAGVSDLRTVRTDVHRALNPVTCTAFPPLVGQLVCVTVVVQNLGPDPYMGTATAQQKPLAGQLTITTDIDEPTKPGRDPVRTAASFSESFPVTIAVMDSAICEFGVVGWIPFTGGTHTASSTVYSSAPNFDPNPANDHQVTIFFVSAGLPAAGWLGLGTLLLALGTLGGLWLRQRRGVRPSGA